MPDNRMDDASVSDGPLWAAVPFKGPIGSKRRLAPLLDETERADLSLAMLDGVLDALLAEPSVDVILVTAPSDTGPLLRRHERLVLLTEERGDRLDGSADNLNRALRQAQVAASSGGASGLLILPSDLPSLGPLDVQALLRERRRPGVVIAPDRAASGTNALLLTPPLTLQPAFGEASFERHCRLAAAAGLDVTRVERPGLALDLDTPADVARLLASGKDSRAARLLRRLDAPARLDRLGLPQARSATI